MLGVVRDEQRRPVGRIRDTVKLSTDAADDLKKKTVQYQTGFEMPPGKYHVKVVVRENQDGTFGSYETDIVVPDLKKDAVKLSSVVVGTQLQAGARKNDRNPLVRDGRELVPNVTHVVSAGQHLYFYYEVYDPAQPVEGDDQHRVLPRQGARVRDAARADDRARRRPTRRPRCSSSTCRPPRSSRASTPARSTWSTTPREALRSRGCSSTSAADPTSG